MIVRSYDCSYTLVDACLVASIPSALLAEEEEETVFPLLELPFPLDLDEEATEPVLPAMLSPPNVNSSTSSIGMSSMSSFFVEEEEVRDGTIWSY